MSSHNSLQFSDQLRSGNRRSRLEAANVADVTVQENGMGGGPTKLWEAANLSASGFADEVARFLELPCVALPEFSEV
jgi:hypothetical protein